MKLILAPMATLSHEALRRILDPFGGWDEYYTEMINASSYLAGGQFEPWYVRQAPCPQKLVWQITGNDTTKIAAAAGRLLSEQGGIGVDINMGCCAPDIVRTGAGFAWMTKPAGETAALIHAVRHICNSSGTFRLSVKMRLGIDENYDRLYAFAKMLVTEGVDLITLHPRTGKEKFKRTARWPLVKRLADDLPIPVYGNGDIMTATAATEHESYAPDGLMIGRGAVRRPWLAAAAKHLPVPPIDIQQLGIDFIQFLQESQPPEFFKSRARRFFFYFCDNLTFGHTIKMQIQNLTTPQEITGIWNAYFDRVPTDRLRIS